MYKIDYLDKSIELSTIDEIINLIKKISSNPTDCSFLLSVTLPNKDIISFGIDTIPNYIMIFFKPYSNRKDCKISCDSSLPYENSPSINFLYPHSTFILECNKYNLLPIEAVLPHVHTLLTQGDLSPIPCYSH